MAHCMHGVAAAADLTFDLIDSDYFQFDKSQQHYTTDPNCALQCSAVQWMMMPSLVIITLILTVFLSCFCMASSHFVLVFIARFLERP